MPHPSQFNTQVIALYLLLFDYSKHAVGNPLIKDSSDDIIPGNSQKESTFGIQVLKNSGRWWTICGRPWDPEREVITMPINDDPDQVQRHKKEYCKYIFITWKLNSY